jgi:hypothetical protein
MLWLSGYSLGRALQQHLDERICVFCNKFVIHPRIASAPIQPARRQTNEKLTITAALLTSLVANISFASLYYKPGFATQVNDVRIGGFLEGSEQLSRSAENGLWLPVVPPLAAV